MKVTETFLLVVVILQVLIIGILLSIRKKDDSKGIEGAIYKLWHNMGIDKALGEVSAQLKQIQEVSKFLERAFRIPQERGNLGEIALEGILSDQLPPDMFGIRERILSGKIPDAYIKSLDGIICIDSKFPLDNYVKMQEATDSKEIEDYKKRFLSDVRLHLSKIERDYVRPDLGTAPFAFAYLPSESIYWFLVKEAFDMVREYIRRGVHIVSPLTLSHRLELIKASVQARMVSEKAEKILEELESLRDAFRKLDERWKVFYDTHLRNLWNKAGEIDLSYRELREKLDRISKGL